MSIDVVSENTKNSQPKFKTKDKKNYATPTLSSFTDQAWKEALNLFFKDFLALCYPHIHDDIDWNFGYEILEQERHKIIVHGMRGKLVDKFIKVTRKNSVNIHILLHIELQGQKFLEFSQTMFTYHYRSLDRYGIPVVSLGLLLDNDFHWRPNEYNTQLWGCYLNFGFPILKILDFKAKKEMLAQSDNPFAMVILCQLAALESKTEAIKRKDLKFDLTKALLKKKWPLEKIRALLKFLDGVLRLPEPLELEYSKQVMIMEEEEKVSYITSFEYYGIRKGESTMLLAQLEAKFGSVPEDYVHRIQSANPNILITWGKRAIMANSLQEIFSNKK